MNTETSLLVALFMLLGNAFFVGAEFGLVSARRSNVELEALNGSRAAKTTLGAMERVSLMLAGAQLGVTVCSLILGAVSEPLVAHLLAAPFDSFGLSTGLVHLLSLVIALVTTVYLHVVIGEMVPKNLALASPTRTALLLTPPLLVFVEATRPVVATLNVIASGCLRLLGVDPKQEITSSFSRDEVAGFVKESHREGLLSRDEEHLLSGALSFDEQTVRSVILPLETIVYANKGVTPAEIEQLSLATGFSRFPVRDSHGDLTGYIHLKDVIGLDDGEHHQPIRSRLIRPLTTLKTTVSLREALVIMQRSGAHLAQITTTKGRVTGIVALEDVLEELVGAIRDDTQKLQR
jgi:CBS domain containing-hemolysin-like protein